MADYEFEDEEQSEADDVQRHIRSDDLMGVQSKILHIEFVSSLEDLAKNSSKSVWRLNPDMLQNLRHIKTTQSRSKAGKDDLVGDLTKTVLLHAEIIEQKCEAPCAIGYDIPGIMPTVLTSGGRFAWVTPPCTETTLTEKTVFEPDSVLTKHMYATLSKCDINTINQEIKFDGDSDMAQIKSSGVASAILQDNLMQGYWEGADGLYEDVNQQLHAGRRWLEVPTPFAREIHDHLTSEIQPMEESFVNFKDFQVRIKRADGQPWNSYQNMAGRISSIGGEVEDQHSISNATLSTSYYMSIKLKIDYVTF